MSNQQRRVYEYLKTHKEISQREAYPMGIYRLSAVVFELKKLYPIKSDLRTVKNADGTVSRVAFYSLIKFE